MDKYNLALENWRKKKVTNDAELSEALNGYRVSFSYNSSKIENEKITFHDTREVFDNDGVTNYTGDLRTLFELKNAKLAHEFFLDAFDKKLPVTKELVLEFHKLITMNTYDERRYRLGERPGTYKKHDYVTGKDEIGASPEDVEEEMDELLDEMNEITPDIALKAAAYFHVKFENIHPFADGNGRTGRIIMNYILVTNEHPPITIHEEDKEQYYDSLEKWDSKQNLNAMISFLKEQTVKTWNKQIERKKNKSI